MPGMTENDIYEALGVSPESENNPEAAEPEEQETDTAAEQESEKNPEAAEPEEQGEPEEDPEASEEAEEKPKQSLEQRRQNAARRRQQELEDAVTKAVEAEREAQKKQMDSFIAALGKKDPYTGEPITTLEQFQKAQADEKRAAVTKDLKAGRLTAEGLQEAIRTMPEMQKLQQLTEQAETNAGAAQQAKADAENEKFRQTAEREIEEIGKLNPKIRSLNDILQMETGNTFAKYVRENGLSFIDAYRLANADALANAKAAAAAQAQKNSAASKSHLVGTQARGDGAVQVPSEVMAEYRAFMPNATDDEIRRHYEKFTKNQKR